MKKKFVLLAILLGMAGYAQLPTNAFVNSGAMSKNLNCGIGEIFIIPEAKPVTPPKKEAETTPTEDTLPTSPPGSDTIGAYPNPTNDFVYIVTSLDVKQVSLYSMEGKWVMDANISVDNRLDLGSLPAGIYLLISNEQKFNPIKIVKK